MCCLANYMVWSTLPQIYLVFNSMFTTTSIISPELRLMRAYLQVQQNYPYKGTVSMVVQKAIRDHQDADCMACSGKSVHLKKPPTSHDRKHSEAERARSSVSDHNEIKYLDVRVIIERYYDPCQRSPSIQSLTVGRVRAEIRRKPTTRHWNHLHGRVSRESDSRSSAWTAESLCKHCGF
jgi:hypothetical protein